MSAADEPYAPDRHIPVRYDRYGDPEWHTVLSLPDSSVGICTMVPTRVIPVIFVPGVMGSNLKGKKNDDIKWRMDSKASMFPWLRRGPGFRKQYLTPGAMIVDDGGLLPTTTQQHPDELKNRGWGEVGAISYGDWLAWLENALNDFESAHAGLRDQMIGIVMPAAQGGEALTRDEVALSYRYRFPVWACGYNWLDDNKASAGLLQKRINTALDRYRGEGKTCDKVILVTHSMGGLVARYASEVMGMTDTIYGIVHGVMPAIGAAATYRRIKSGTESPRGPANPKTWMTDVVTSGILGGNAAANTAVMSGAPGPLQLLPTAEYGNGWLRIEERGSSPSALPQHGDPYSEIYTVRGAWWGLIDDQLINPLNTESDSRRHQMQVDADWNQFSKLMISKVRAFHQDIAGKYHGHTYAFYGADSAYPAYGNVTWTGGSRWGVAALSGNRPADPWQAKALDPGEMGSTRTVATPMQGIGWKTEVNQGYTISDPEEMGDGTVPQRSGKAPLGERGVQICVPYLGISHEGAYRVETCKRFTLWAITKIAQRVKGTVMAYDAA
jgi:PGAP1-like protein